MMLLLILINLISYSEEVKIHQNNDKLPIENLSHNEKGIIMGFGNSGGRLYYLLSEDGKTYDSLNSYKFLGHDLDKFTNTYSSVASGDYFIFSKDFATLFRTNDLSSTFDTLILDKSKKYAVCKFTISQNDTNVFLYSFNNINQNGKPAFDLYLSTDAFNTYEIIDFDILKDTFNIIQDVKIFNNHLNIYSNMYIESRTYQISKFSYNLETKEYKTQTYPYVDFFNFKVIADNNGELFLYSPVVYEYVPKGNNLHNKMLINLNNNGYNILDTVGRNNSFANTFSYLDDKKIYSLHRSRFSIYDIEQRHLDTFYFPSSYFDIDNCIHDPEDSYSWKDKNTGNIFISSGKFCVYEIDINSILNVNSNESYSSVYPNPANRGENVFIELEDFASSIEIYDLKGNKKLSLNSFSNNFEISTNDLQAGVYFLIYDFNDRKKISKLIIQ